MKFILRKKNDKITVGDLFDQAVDKTLKDKEFMQFAKDMKT